jgi:hypothetical protein
MISLTNWCHLTDIATTPRNAPSGPSKNTLWRGSPQLTPHSHCTCGTDCYHKRKSRWISCGPRGCILSSLPLLTLMVSWITTKQLLLRQDAKSLHMRNQESDALGLPTGNMATRWVPQCIITDVKMYKSRSRPVSESWILSSSFSTIIRCHSYRPPTYCSWLPKT